MNFRFQFFITQTLSYLWFLSWFYLSSRHFLVQNQQCKRQNNLGILLKVYDNDAYFSGMFIVNFEHISHIIPVFPLLNLKKINTESVPFWYLIICGCSSTHLRTMLSCKLRRKWNFPLRISSVNVTRSADNCGFGHISWRNP